MHEHRVEHSVLVFGRERRQRVCGRRTDAASRERLEGAGRQSDRQVVAAHDPVGLPPQEGRDGAHGQVVVIDERRDDPRLVGRGDGAGRRVGRQHKSLVLDGGERTFHDDGDSPAACVAPSLEQLEAVEDLVAAVVGGHDAQWAVGKGCARRRQLSRTKSGETSANEIDGKVAHGAWRLLVRLCVIEHSAPARLTGHQRSPQTASRATRPHSRRSHRLLHRRSLRPAGIR